MLTKPAIRLLFCVVALYVAARGVNARHGLGNPDNLITYDEHYVDGLTAYNVQKYGDTIRHFGLAMQDYNELVEARLQCYAKCHRSSIAKPLEFSTDSELEFFDVVLHRSGCIERCKEDFVGAYPLSAVPYSISDLMELKEAYNYLQMAYYHEGDVKQAAKAAATYNYYNPYSIHTKANMKFYEGRSVVTKEDLEPLETKAYRDLYIKGQEQYFAQNWKDMIETFESSLQEFRSALQDCHLLCEGPLKYSNAHTLSLAMISSLKGMLNCKHNCVEKLGRFRQDKQEHFLVNQSLAAAEASATQTRLEPDSEVAKRNGVFYRQQKGITRNDFNVRKDMLLLVESLEFESKLKHIIDMVSSVELDESESDQAKASSEAGNDEQLLDGDFQKYPIGVSDLMEDESEPIVIEGPRDTNERERLVMDRMITEKECSLLLELVTKLGKEGDGYPQKSPHTMHEKFEGLTIHDAAKATLTGEVNMTLSKLYLKASKKAKDVVATQFKLQQPLYFSFTHLVCRTAKDDQKHRDDLSHPVHSDNCILDMFTGECNKVPPAYTWRDYSAIIYLNNNFEGGQFFFAHSTVDLTPEHYVNGQCGRMVAFSAGKENMHGVTAVTKGRRCAVALWFTLDPDHQENSYDVAAKMLNGASYS